jgi:hypothetical protein
VYKMLSSAAFFMAIAEEEGEDLGASSKAVMSGGANDLITMDTLNIATKGNATDFGDNSTGYRQVGGFSSSTRGVFGGGLNSSLVRTTDIRYITIASNGNSSSFGSLGADDKQQCAGFSNDTRGLFCGGRNTSSVNTAVYITIATTGNSSAFGVLTGVGRNVACLASSTRGIRAGGDDSGSTDYNTIDYCTIASTGNFSDFGDLLEATTGVGGSSDGTYGLIKGGTTDIFSSYISTTQRITIASTGNAETFGTLTQARAQTHGTSNKTTSVTCGGSNGSAQNTIDYSFFATSANSLDFGDLSVARSEVVAISDNHGGL